MDDGSFVRLFGEQEGGSCGYCKNESTKKSTWYCKINPLSCEDYKALIDRGWRRSGTLCYKPTNSVTCCPAYPIRCNTIEFKISKSQKEVLKNMAEFLNTGTCKRLTRSFDERGDSSISLRNELNKSLEMETNAACGDEMISKKFDLKTSPIHDSVLAPSGDTVSNTKNQSNITAPRSNSAKRLRWRRTQQRLLDRSQKENISFDDLMKEYQMRRNKRLEKNRPKELEDYLKLVLPKDTAKHFIELRLCSSHPRSSDFNATIPTEHKLYQTYQMAVHGDEISEVTLPKFLRFLVESPLKKLDFKDSTELENKPPVFGSYHQQYWLDGKKLIAVGVIDMLPECLSSVYSFYDPEYAFLKLGTYSALREIEFVRNLYRLRGPSGIYPQKCYGDFRFYYMGYYIDSCVKMRYKGQYLPSYLACPETYQWVPIGDCQRLLKKSKYARFSDSSATDVGGIDISIQELRSRIFCVLPDSPLIRSFISPLQSQHSNEDSIELLPLNIAARVLTKNIVSLVIQWAKLVGKICLDGRLKLDFRG